MTIPVSSPPRERIVQAALALLESGGVDAVSTRAVSAAAGVQVPTLYRQFGDMQGLLEWWRVPGLRPTSEPRRRGRRGQPS